MKLRLICALVMVLAPLVSAAQNPDIKLTKIGDGVYAAIATPGGKAGSNAGFVIGDHAVLVIDSFLADAPAQAMLAEIRKLTTVPVRYLVNTHYHLDHTGGNRVFAEAGATIIAQRNVGAWERTENLKFFGATPKPEERARVEALVLPDVLYNEAVDVHLGQRVVDVRYMRGHTGGDSLVIVPDANVVFTGDLFWQKSLPNLIDASTGPWIETLNRLLADHPSAQFVSGHGGLGSAADVRDFRDYLVFLRQQIVSAQKEGKSGQALEDAVFQALQAKYGTWAYFDHFARRNIQQTITELNGTKKIPVPPR